MNPTHVFPSIIILTNPINDRIWQRNPVLVFTCQCHMGPAAGRSVKTGVRGPMIFPVIVAITARPPPSVVVKEAAKGPMTQWAPLGDSQRPVSLLIRTVWHPMRKMRKTHCRYRVQHPCRGHFRRPFRPTEISCRSRDTLSLFCRVMTLLLWHTSNFDWNNYLFKLNIEKEQKYQ